MDIPASLRSVESASGGFHASKASMDLRNLRKSASKKDPLNPRKKQHNCVLLPLWQKNDNSEWTRFSFMFSAVNQFCTASGISVTLHLDFRRSDIYFLELTWCEFYSQRSKIFFQSVQLGSARNGNNPWFLCK
jgi:hypothetical protein